ncbi:hypothetical protein ACQ4PT_009307 [Festuca glaucescens]
MAAVAAHKKIEKLREAVAKLDQMSANEKAGFVSFVSRYLSGDTEQIDWRKIEAPANEAVVHYDTLAPAPEDLNAIKALLEKLVVLKLNGGLETTMGCTGPK